MQTIYTIRCFLSCSQCSLVNISVSVHYRLNTDSPSVGSIDNQTYGRHVDVTEKNTTGNAELMFSDEIQRCVFVTINNVIFVNTIPFYWILAIFMQYLDHVFSLPFTTRLFLWHDMNWDFVTDLLTCMTIEIILIFANLKTLKKYVQQPYITALWTACCVVCIGIFGAMVLW